jgi:hypothetical protein
LDDFQHLQIAILSPAEGKSFSTAAEDPDPFKAELIDLKIIPLLLEILEKQTGAFIICFLLLFDDCTQKQANAWYGNPEEIAKNIQLQRVQQLNPIGERDIFLSFARKSF